VLNPAHGSSLINSPITVASCFYGTKIIIIKIMGF